MNPDTAHDEHPGVTRVELMYARGDFATIDKMVKFWEAIEKLGMLGGLAYRTVIWLAAMLGAGYAFYHFVYEWVRSVPK